MASTSAKKAHKKNKKKKQKSRTRKDSEEHMHVGGGGGYDDLGTDTTSPIPLQLRTNVDIAKTEPRIVYADHFGMHKTTPQERENTQRRLYNTMTASGTSMDTQMYGSSITAPGSTQSRPVPPLHLIGQGSFGCVYSPPLCGPDHQVTKLLTKRAADEEMRIYSRLGLDGVDPNEQFFVYDISSCLDESVIPTIIQQGAMDKCLTKLYDHEKRVHKMDQVEDFYKEMRAINYTNGGDSFTHKWRAALHLRHTNVHDCVMHLKRLILSLSNVFDGITLLYTQGVAHNDLAPSNLVVIDDEDVTRVPHTRIIDFGASFRFIPDVATNQFTSLEDIRVAISPSLITGEVYENPLSGRYRRFLPDLMFIYYDTFLHELEKFYDGKMENYLEKTIALWDGFLTKATAASIEYVHGHGEYSQSIAEHTTAQATYLSMIEMLTKIKVDWAQLTQEIADNCQKLHELVASNGGDRRIVPAYNDVTKPYFKFCDTYSFAMELLGALFDIIDTSNCVVNMFLMDSTENAQFIIKYVNFLVRMINPEHTSRIGADVINKEFSKVISG